MPRIMSFESFVEAYGYWALLFGTFLEGETILIIGGFLARISQGVHKRAVQCGISCVE